MLQRHQDLTAGVGYRCKCVNHCTFLFLLLKMWGGFSLLWLGRKPSQQLQQQSVLTLKCFFSFCPQDFDEWQKANLLAIRHAISSYDNHILTVQMRKWLIGLVINIMSYYPGQRNYFIKPGYIYLCSPMHLFCSFPSVLLHVRLQCCSIRGYTLISFEQCQYDWV